MEAKSPVLILDNNDSFTYNLVQLVESIDNQSPVVVNSENASPDACRPFHRILISPGPGLPSEFPMLREIILSLGPTHSILGVCLGHQAIAVAFGGSLLNLPRVNHGISVRLSEIDPKETLFDGIQEGEAVGLYHSWSVVEADLPSILTVTARCEEGRIQAIRHRTMEIRGVQFHPESVITHCGARLLKNWLAAFLLLVGWVLGGCSNAEYDVDPTTIFRYNEDAGITSLDPAFARDQANIWAVNQLFNGLLQFDDSLRLEPCLATTWNTSPDGMTYTFHLRTDVRFHDDPCFPDGHGRSVTAQDFVFSFNRIRDPKTASPGAWVFEHVIPDEPFVALNDSVLQIHLSTPFPPFPGILAMVYGVVVAPEAIRFYGDDFRKHPVGTGPFRFAYWKEGVKLVLRKNPHYFETGDSGSQLPYLEAIVIRFIADKQAEFMQFLQGKLDFLSGIDPSYKDELLTPSGTLSPVLRNRFCMTTAPYLNTEYLGFLSSRRDPNKAINPDRARLIRQAVGYGFDREKMIRYLRNHIGTPGIYGIVPPGMPGFDDQRIWYDYQPSKTQSLLRQAGYTATSPPPPITLSTTPDYLDLCKFIQHQLQESGITLEIEVIPPAAMKEMKAQARLPFFRASWIADYPDAENYLSMFFSPYFSPQGPNYTHYSNPLFDSLFRISFRIGDAEERYRIYRKMEALVMEDAPVVILYYDQVVRFTPVGIEGLGINPMNMLSLKKTRKKAGITSNASVGTG